MTNVRAGSLLFDGGYGQDGFYIRSLKMSVGVRSDAVSIAQDHGEFDVPVLRGSRIATIIGPCIAGSAERLQWREDTLRALLGGGESGRVYFDMPGGTRSGMARLADSPEFDVTLWGSRAVYMLQLKFANPRLFGESRTTSGSTSVAAHHYGNFPATPVLTVTGSKPSGYSIAGPSGKAFTVTKPVVSGSPHSIDMATGFLTVGGVVQSGVVTSGDTWAIPGGDSVTQTLSGSGTATLGVTVRDTYI